VSGARRAWLLTILSSEGKLDGWWRWVDASPAGKMLPRLCDASEATGEVEPASQFQHLISRFEGYGRTIGVGEVCGSQRYAGR